MQVVTRTETVSEQGWDQKIASLRMVHVQHVDNKIPETRMVLAWLCTFLPICLRPLLFLLCWPSGSSYGLITYHVTLTRYRRALTCEHLPVHHASEGCVLCMDLFGFVTLSLSLSLSVCTCVFVGFFLWTGFSPSHLGRWEEIFTVRGG